MSAVQTTALERTVSAQELADERARHRRAQHTDDAARIASVIEEKVERIQEALSPFV